MAKKKKTLAFAVYPSVNLLELDSTLGFLRGLMMRGYEVVVVGETTEPINTDTPLQIAASKTFHEVPHPHGLLVIGSSGIRAIRALGNEPLVQYVQQAASKAELVGSVGTGSLILAAAGLLQGREATTHWAYGKLLEKFGARFSRKRYVEDGKVITAAGGSGGIDMALYLLAKLGSKSQARLVQLFGEYEPQPPFGGIDWAQVDEDALVPVLLRHQTDLHSALACRPDILAAVDSLTSAPSHA